MYLIFKSSALRVLPISGKGSFPSTYGCVCQTSPSRRALSKKHVSQLFVLNFYRNCKHQLDCLHKRKLLSKC